ncbi:hypothetical protein OG689_00345 [Kitasatospora sp. NBC_00240]|uniref:hypothetical protein n=1 Tax=Kitasatospora sp. NBC_00240 TaxID=2903567 RepID=UPI002259DF23|nr:hypothetical protein [Kitasatospora sp. NBC_00240]MCX5207782.1 hypothetical protein [Kitasatospora sp. NBC_00240]
MDEQTELQPTRVTQRVVAQAEPMQAALRPMEAEPVHEALRATVAEPVHEALRATVAEPMQAALRPMEAEPVHEALRATVAEPMQAALRPAEVDAVRPLAAQTRSTALRSPEGESLAAQDSLGAETGEASATKRLADPTSQDGLPTSPTAAAASVPGSAGSGFQIDPEQYSAAIGPILAASDQLAQLVTGLTAYLDHTQSAAPWGNDESGKKFAEGEKGYLTYSTGTLKGLKGMPEAVRFIADGLKAMTENYRNSEAATAQVFGGAGGAEADVAAVRQPASWSAPVDPTLPTATLRGIADAPSHTNRKA